MEKTKYNKLPKWLEDLLPTAVEPHIIKAQKQDNKTIILLEAPDGSITAYDNFIELSKAKATNSIDVIFDESMKVEFKDNFIGDMLLFPLSNGNSGSIISYSDNNRLEFLQKAYESFLNFEEEYTKDSKDFVAAWNFIDTHPAFWTCASLKDTPWQWSTNGYCSKIAQYVTRKNGKTTVSLSGGGHVPVATYGIKEPYTEHYADWRLEAYSDTFEEAVIELAFRVSKSFNNEGESLAEESFPQDPPSWLLELRNKTGE